MKAGISVLIIRQGSSYKYIQIEKADIDLLKVFVYCVYTSPW